MFEATNSFEPIALQYVPILVYVNINHINTNANPANIIFPGAPEKNLNSGANVCFTPPATNTAKLSSTNIKPTVTIMLGTFKELYKNPIAIPINVPQPTQPKTKPKYPNFSDKITPTIEENTMFAPTAKSNKPITTIKYNPQPPTEYIIDD